MAHSESADKINKVHISTGAAVRLDFLPSMNQLVQMMNDSGLDVTFRRADESYFICIARK